jgi:plasmid stabilization system protein ParE
MPSKYEVLITATAEADLREVFAYIAEANPENAEKFIGFLAAQVSTLEKMPLRCPPVPENKVLGTQYRHLLYGEYRAIFKIEKSHVIVMRIVHGSRLMDDGMGF